MLIPCFKNSIKCFFLIRAFSEVLTDEVRGYFNHNYIELHVNDKILHTVYINIINDEKLYILIEI